MRTKRWYRRIPVSILVVVAVLAASEVAVRAAADRLREPLLWPGWEAHNKVAAMDALASRGGASVVFVGSSIVNAGLDPSVATRLWGGDQPVFNAALNGSDLRATSIWTREVVVPRLHPDVVVIGFSSGELNDHWNGPNTLYSRLVKSHYGRSAAGTGSVLEKIDDWMIDHSYLIRYRSVLRKPVEAFSRKPHRVKETQGVDGLGTLRLLRKFQQRPYSPGLSRQLGIWDEVFRNYRAGEQQFAALDQLVNQLTGRGIAVVLVRMPVTKDVIPLHPTGQADRDEFGRLLASFVASHPVTFLDAEASIGGSPDLFVDPLHLNTAGELRTTTLVVDTLKSPRRA